MQNKNWRILFQVFLFVCLFALSVGGRAAAQDSGNSSQIFITGSKVSSPPNVDLTVYGMDGSGNPLDFSQQTLTVYHNGVPSGPVTANGRTSVGTFTLFLIDIPPGVSAQLPAIQEAIKQFASPATMQEGLDVVAIYKAGETAAAQILPPEQFHNSVSNLFATPLEPELGATALLDSLGGLIDQINELKPDPAMTPAIVVMSDGTDVVSTAFSENEIASHAVAMGVPIHTIWLTNEDLSPGSQQFGQDYLASVAAGSRGLTARLQDTADLGAIWGRIASFRDQTSAIYPVQGMTGGEATVELILADGQSVSAESTVTIPGNLPMITIDLPLESRELSLPNLDKPVKLRFSTTLAWLDGETRELAAAQLKVNDLSYDIPVVDIAQFDVDVSNLGLGMNSVEVAVLDIQGLRVTSPEIQLIVTEGSKSLPPELEPGSGFLAMAGRIFLWLVVLAILLAVLIFTLRKGRLSGLADLIPRGPSHRRSAKPAEAPPTKPVIEAIQMRTIARIEVLDAETQTQPLFELSQIVERIGRSPAQSNIAFENDITVSRLHASLHLEGSHYRIFDEHSTSGTWVNDQQVPEYGIQLMDGDEIHLGAVHLRYRQP
ncbi:MAG: FHA domain-containing protein [Ardenticatenaceae bacterium]|nr:FHA domain-containing protein [Ardenticatenaceae bacterium]MCB9444636.1 FHA domain-containing protein [Ardenticatenaceae bacterium]